jgi:hypothetical protein
MTPELTNQVIPKLESITLIGKAKDTESLSLQEITPIVIPNANQFAGYQQGQRRYFKILVTVDFQEINEEGYNVMPEESVIT